MSVRAKFDQAAVNIFDAFGDAIDNVTYTITGAWNPVTETSSDTAETIRVSVKPITRDEADGEVMTGDMMATIIQSEMTATPKIDDKLTLNSVDYLVRSVVDKYTILWELELRRV